MSIVEELFQFLVLVLSHFELWQISQVREASFRHLHLPVFRSSGLGS